MEDSLAGDIHQAGAGIHLVVEGNPGVVAEGDIPPVGPLQLVGSFVEVGSQALSGQMPTCSKL